LAKGFSVASRIFFPMSILLETIFLNGILRSWAKVVNANDAAKQIKFVSMVNYSPAANGKGGKNERSTENSIGDLYHQLGGTHGKREI
jgi:hypothetical protein